MRQLPSPEPRRAAVPIRLSRRLALALVAALLTAGPTHAAAPAAQPAATTVIVLGDSQAQGLAGALERQYLRDSHYRILDRSRIGTGLVGRGYDWPGAARDLAGAHHGQVAVIMFGANDRPPFHIEQVDAAVKEQFRRVYDKRVRDVIRAFRDADIDVIWLGHPIVRDGRYSDDMAFLNQIFEQAAKEEGARWVPLWDLVADPQGGYTAFGKGADGETRRLRADDGVHFTPSGYDLVASRVRPLLEEHRATLSPGTPSPSAALGQ
ncbi:MAG: DUF459 domain-containing protein [Alphaproteobacteria bacterium]|nr:DUF459 domain-containing protein [Alphaproteobacteria bacterium]